MFKERELQSICTKISEFASGFDEFITNELEGSYEYQYAIAKYNFVVPKMISNSIDPTYDNIVHCTYLLLTMINV